MVEKDYTIRHASLLGRIEQQVGTATSDEPLWQEMFATDQFGRAVPNMLHSLTLGPRGPVLMQDYQLILRQQSLNRERIAERVVHAKGAGAHGTFTCTSDVFSKYCKSKIFAQNGKQTSIFVRFSSVSGERGFHDLNRDPRGMAIKFYSQDPGEGILDWVFNNTPIFFIRDGMKFPDLVHAIKRDPQSNLRRETHARAMDLYWDFFSLTPESIHQIMYMYGDRGIPLSWRAMNGYSGHTLRTVNSAGESFFVKIHVKSQLGVQNFDSLDDALEQVRINPDSHQQDLYENIERGNYPRWTVSCQVMSQSDAERFEVKYGFSIFDMTKVWPHADFPLQEFGVMELNRNPLNYFAEVEQAAFSPANMVAGFEPTPDRVLQARMFAYYDAHLHRLGPNYWLLPINCGSINGVDRAVIMNGYFRDGQHQHTSNYGMSAAVYPSSSDLAPKDGVARHDESLVNSAKIPENYSGNLTRGDMYDESTQFPSTLTKGIENSLDIDFCQPRVLWQRVWNDAQRERFVRNVAQELSMVTQEQIINRMLMQFHRVDPECGERVARALGIEVPTSTALSEESQLKMSAKRGLEMVKESVVGAVESLLGGTAASAAKAVVGSSVAAPASIHQ